ncbi:MAG: BamA/TamA family outer membrane protein [Gemmatimonadota bacterium]|nr:MAG: BamA/TamA family outer membrane protein [Gemmatimonadota bacterium]
MMAQSLAQDLLRRRVPQVPVLCVARALPLALSIVLLSSLPPGRLLAQEAEGEEEVEPKRSGLIPIPVLSYTPETKFAFGVAAQYYYRPEGADAGARPSTITPLFIYTTKKQIIAEFYSSLWWAQEEYHLTGNAGYTKFPDKFYGIGNDTSEDDEEDYTPRYTRLRADIQRRIVSEFRLGLGYEFEYSELEEVEEGGVLDSGDILGSEGGVVSGATILASWDTRDNIFSPSSGHYHQLSVGLYGDAIGSDYEFGRYVLDLRGYINTLPDHVLALQGYLGLETGDPPFQHLLLFGGQDLMRGHYQGRFRDENMFVVQAEYRIVPIWWRFGAVAFAGFGDVADEPSSFNLGDFKYSVGGGIRFLLNRAERIALRFDFGFGEGTSGFYITLGEAF